LCPPTASTWPSIARLVSLLVPPKAIGTLDQNPTLGLGALHGYTLRPNPAGPHRYLTFLR